MTMSDAADRFRARLAEELRAAFAVRNREATRTLRCIMAALDNAGAVSPEAQARYAAASITEAPRRPLSEQEIAALLQAEIAARSKTADIYEHVGNAAQATQLRDEIATIAHLTTLLH